MFRTVTAKLHTMRKAQEFIAQPMSDGRTMVQSDKSIGMFDPATGKGHLCTRGSYGGVVIAKNMIQVVE